MKLEVGMYVRLVNDVEDIVVINKIANVFETTILTENNGSIYQGEYTKENVVKASYDIIDLIKVGDYVNGREVIDIKLKCDETIKCLITHGYDITNEMIKSIVTKEMFSSMEYRLGDDE